MELFDLVGFEGLYQINKLGGVFSLRRSIYLKPKTDRDGYLSYCLVKDGKNHHLREHRLVAINFLANPSKLPVVNHRNFDKQDNRVDNLEWCTVLHNNMHYISKEKPHNTLSSKSKDELEGIIKFYCDNNLSISGVIKSLNLGCGHEDLRRLLNGTSFKSLVGLSASVIKSDDFSSAMEILHLKFNSKMRNGEISKLTGRLDSYVSRVVNRKRLTEVYDSFMENDYVSARA